GAVEIGPLGVAGRLDLRQLRSLEYRRNPGGACGEQVDVFLAQTGEKRGGAKNGGVTPRSASLERGRGPMGLIYLLTMRVGFGQRPLLTDEADRSGKVQSSTNRWQTPGDFAII